MSSKTFCVSRLVLSAMLMAALTLGLAACGLSPVPLDDEPAEQPKQTAPVQDQQGEVATTTGEAEQYGTEGDIADGLAYSDMATEDIAFVNTPYEYNTEEYAAVEETGFVAAATTPVSTISADVDTASYANLRRMLQEGYRPQAAADEGEADGDDRDEDEYGEYGDPYLYGDVYDTIPAGAVRIEELVNYFDYGYDVPEDDGFAITAHVGPCPWNDDTELLALGFATPREDPAVREAGVNLVFLIDVSGSMDEPDKLPLLKSSFGELVKSLGEKDLVSIVTYSGEEEVVLDGESGANHRKIMKAVRGLEADGSTNGEAGLRMAYELAEDNFIEGGVNRIVMASDGDLNVGMTSESDLHDFVEKKRESGVYLSVLGFGAGNYKDTKMETLADNGNGSYHYIDCEEEAERVFGERLCANLVPFADDVKMQVEFNPAQVKGYRLIGYENRALAVEDFEDDEKDAGEVGPESQFTVLYEIVRPDSALQIETPELKYGTYGDNGSSEWLTAKVRYRPLGESEACEQELALGEEAWSEDPGDDWHLAAAVTEFGMLLRDSDYVGTSTYDSIRKLVGEPEDTQRQELLDLVDLAENN